MDAYVCAMKTEFDILIIGAGLVGLTTALACAQSGAQVALLDRRDIEVGHDGRASALSSTSLHLFVNLGVEILADVQPIRDMLVTEGAPNSPWRLHFEGGGDSKSEPSDLGGIIENSRLKSALIAKVQASSSIQIFAPNHLDGFEDSGGSVSIETDQGTLTAQLLIGADGRESAVRRKTEISRQRFDYAAASLVTTISHTLPHDGLAWQRIIKGGALAVLPLTGARSQIVWSGPTKAIDAAAALSDPAFLALLSEKMDGYLGQMQLTAPRQTYPLRLQIADQFSKGRIALAGDAAHIIHPLAGQGLNLGLRDAAALAEGIKSARGTGQDLGVASLIDYALWRNTDTRVLGALTHMISESSSAKGPIGHIRRLGMAMINRSPDLKSMFETRAAGENRDLPELLKKGP